MCFCFQLPKMMDTSSCIEKHDELDEHEQGSLKTIFSEFLEMTPECNKKFIFTSQRCNFV